jgi:hypothetical protein
MGDAWLSPQFVLAPIASLVGVVVGALLVYRLNAQLEVKKVRVAARNAAYVDFLSATIDAMAAQRGGDKAALDTLAIRLWNAKLRIGLHGSHTVVDAVIDLDRAPTTAATNDAFLAIYERMRSDGVDKGEASARLSQLLFGVVKNPSHTLRSAEEKNDGP